MSTAQDRMLKDHAQIINVISTKRSGHHAFIYWLRQGLKREVVFCNNVLNADRLGSALSDYSNKISDHQDKVPAPILLLNFEGVSPAGLRDTIDAMAGIGADVVNILFLRDPLNLCASLIHRKTLIELELVAIMRQLFAERDWLEAYQANGADLDLKLIYYNPWLTDDAYRSDIASALSLTSSERYRSESQYGGGSSFADMKDGVGEADVEKLTTRWRHYRHDARFNALISHPTMMPWFEKCIAGEIKDSFGRSDRDDERLAHLKDVRSGRRPRYLIDNAAAYLSARPDIFYRYDRAGALEKRLMLLAASTKILAGVR